MSDGPALFGNVWLATSNEATTLHVSPDCPRLSNASVRGPVDKEKFPHGEFCGWCSGHAENKATESNGRDLYEAAKAAGMGDD